MSEKVLKTLDAAAFHGSTLGSGETLQESGAQVKVDVSARLREMW